MTIDELIAALGKATGPDQDLDVAIWRTIPATDRPPIPPPYTASIDSALTLLPENCTSWDLLASKSGPTEAYIYDGAGENPWVGLGESPALAICLAAMWARVAA